MTGFGNQNKFNKKSKKSNNKINPSKEQILNQAFQFHSKGNIYKAAKYYEYFINQGFKDHRVFSNYGVILKSLGKLKEAALSYRKSIEMKPDFAEGHSNLGNILKSLGKLKEAELSFRKSIKIKTDFASGYYSLSLLKYSNKDERWKDKLFSENILINKSQKEKVYIFFARANILHNEKRYEESASYLQLANNLKLVIYPSNSDHLIKKSKKLLFESDKKEFHKKEHKSSSENIFIVGMPRSGSTLLESILSMSILKKI